VGVEPASCWIMSEISINGSNPWHHSFFFLKKSSVIKSTTVDTNEQKTIGGVVADPAACVVSMPECTNYVVSSLGREEQENYTKCYPFASLPK